ncbi:MAG: GNAT family N-acetyltransferase [Rickettsiales bacterium]|nr:GNAT family N-acetyltransferase [Rickettsiales bacterium]
MTIRNLENMFKPQSIAVIGASNQSGSIGHVVIENILASGFSGPIMPLNPKHASISGIIAYPDVASLPIVPDLAILCIAPSLVPKTIAELGERGTRAAVVISAGFTELGTAEGKALEQQLLAAAKPYGLRIIGPNCLGIMVPGVKLNATFSHLAAAPGKLAFLSQSGALCTAILDYVAARDIGFSHFISLGNCSDVDFGDMLDYLANDDGTSAILLYVEAITHVRKFMSAARAAARNKPVIVIKSGRNQAGAKAAASHTGALIGSDAVYDVAFKRAGMLRVDDMEELFDSVETLARLQPNSLSQEGDRMLIVSNGGGPAVLATDYLISNGGRLAELSEATQSALNKVLPPTWSHGNPIDIIGDANGKRYSDAMSIVLQAEEADAVFVMKCPTAVSDNVEAAKAVIAADRHGKQLFTCWLGEATATESRKLFAEAGIATYDMPEKAMRAFLHMVEYRHNQKMLLEAPSSTIHDHACDETAIRAIIEKAFAEGRDELFEHEAKEVLAACGIPVVRTYTVNNAEEAANQADQIGYPVVLKIRSPDISHKSDVGGVALALANRQAVVQAAEKMLTTIPTLKPTAKLEGFTVQQMVMRKGYELIVGMSTDQQFGPVILFGEGGVAVEVINDKVLGLPPFNSILADDMIQRTRVYQRLKGFRDQKPVHFPSIIHALMQISQLACTVSDIAELDINPLIADSEGAIALDARIKIRKQPENHMVISPYPESLEEPLTLKNQEAVLVRPIKPDDAVALKTMIQQLTPQDLYQRFRGEYPAVGPAQIARLTHLDYDRDMVLVATSPTREIYGGLLCYAHPGSNEAEFTVVVRPDKKGLGLGHALVDKMIRYAHSKPNIEYLVGYAFKENTTIITMLQEFGFTIEICDDVNIVKVTHRVRPA